MEAVQKRDKLEQAVRRIFEQDIPFHRMMGLRVISLAAERIEMKVAMRDEFIGHFVHRNLHGGVTATILDVTGSLAAFIGALAKHEDEDLDRQLSRFNSLGTIDLRVDYLRPGRGSEFNASGFVLRIGSKVAVTRMELHDDSGNLIATGTGAYTVS